MDLPAILAAFTFLSIIGVAIYFVKYFDNEENDPDTDSSYQSYSDFGEGDQPTEQGDRHREEKQHSEQRRREEEYRRQAEEQEHRQEYARQQEEQFRKKQEHRRQEEQERIIKSKNDDNYYANILELHGQASRSEIKRSYRKLIAQYHPDKVEHLGPELQELANKKTKEIVLAYEYFKKKYSI